MYLAIDTSTDNASLAIVQAGEVLAELNWRCRQNHSVELMPRLSQLLQNSGLDLKCLSGIVVAIGPGSFNGLRVGVSTAKALAYSLELPLAGISTLEAAAYQYADCGLPVCPIFGAGRGEVAAAIYQKRGSRWHCVAGQQLTTVEGLCSKITSRTIFCGEPTVAVIEKLKEQLGAKAVIPSPVSMLRRAAFLAELGIKRLESGDCDSPAALQPIYLRRPPITQPKRRPTIIKAE